MNKEETINVLNDYDINFEGHTVEEIAEAHEIAIKALEAQPSEDEKVIRIKKGTLKARTGRYVIYDVEWLKTHFNTTEAKIYGQPSEDCVSREAVLSIIKSICFSEEYVQFRADYGINGQRDAAIIYIKALPSVAPQPKEEPQQKTGQWIEHKHGGIEHIECSKCRCWFLRKDLIRNSYCPNCGSRNHWEWELKMQEVKK